MSLRRLLLALAFLAALGAVAPVAAGYRLGTAQLLPRTVLAPLAAGRGSCIDGVQERARTTLLTVPATGFVSARLSGAARGDDWDLAIFDATTRRRLAASAAFGARERVDFTATAGQRLAVQACHIAGPASASPSLLVTERVVDGRLPAPQRLRQVAIRFHDRGDLDRLLAQDIDLNETARGHRVLAVLHGDEDLARLRASGLSFDVTVPDLRAADARARVRERLGARAASVALPSGRSAYRTLADYQADLKQLADANPGIVRKVMLGASLEGRAIEGIEIAKDVTATDDGRPTHVELGLHHAREWSSGEIPTEFAIDLVNGYRAGDPRSVALVSDERTFVFPVINPDGFVAAMDAGGYVAGVDDNGDGGAASLALAAAGSGTYRRKNCRDSSSTNVPCPLANGVDLNRNYGAFWGGPGESDNPTMQTYRGAAPFSEPEATAVHAWSSAHQVMLLNSNHNFAADVLFQPGFSRADEPGLPKGTPVPYQPQMRAVAEQMAQAAGYTAMVSYDLYDVTGATEDWNYFAQGTFGYTTEIGYDNFHPDFQDAVIDQYTGTRDGQLDQGRSPSLGLKEALYRAGEATLNPAYHAVIAGRAPAGRTLRLTKDFQTTTSNVITSTEGAGITGPPQLIPEHLETTLTVPAAGVYTWHVNPSTRPLALLAGQTETWTLTCEDGGVTKETHPVLVAIGELFPQDLNCDGGPPAPTGVAIPNPAIARPSTPAPPPPPPISPPPPSTPVKAATLRLSSPRRTRKLALQGRRVQLTLTVVNGPLIAITARLRDARNHRVAAGRVARVVRSGRLILKAPRRLPAGRYRVVVSARTGAGAAVTAKLTFRLGRPKGQ